MLLFNEYYLIHVVTNGGMLLRVGITTNYNLIFKKLCNFDTHDASSVPM